MSRLLAEYTVTVGGGSVVRKDFERGPLIWDERQAEPWKCYFSSLGKQLTEAQQQIATLQQQLAEARKQPAPIQAPSSPLTALDIVHAVVALLGQTLAGSH